MKMESLIGEVLSRSIKKIRVSKDNYEELIFLGESASALNTLLIKKLGAAIKDGNGPPEPGMKEAALEIAKLNGGIDNHQFLYGAEYNSLKIVIMIWPWQNRKNLTIKKFIV